MACCSHTARVLGSTGQVEAGSAALDVDDEDAGGGWEEGAEGDGDEGSAGVSAFHHPIVVSSQYFSYITNRSQAAPFLASLDPLAV